MADMGTIMARLGLDDSRFKAGVNNAGKWGKAKFAAIGGAMAGAFAAAFSVEKLKEIVTAGKDIKIFSDQAGVAAEQFQKFNTVIEKANGDASDTVSIILDLKRAMADARTGNKQWVADFESLGITMDQIKKDDPVALFIAIGKTVAKTAELTGEQINALGRMMGEDTSARAIAAFRNNFESTMNNAIVLTQKEVDALKEIDDAFNSLGKEGMVAFGQFIVDNKDTIILITQELRKTFQVGVEFFNDVKEAMKFAQDKAAKIASSISTGSAGTGAGMSASSLRDLTALASLSEEQKRRATVRGMFGAAEFTPDALRRNELREAFKEAQKEHLEELKKIQQNTSTNGLSAGIMGG